MEESNSLEVPQEDEKIKFALTSAKVFFLIVASLALGYETYAFFVIYTASKNEGLGGLGYLYLFFPVVIGLSIFYFLILGAVEKRIASGIGKAIYYGILSLNILYVIFVIYSSNVAVGPMFPATLATDQETYQVGDQLSYNFQPTSGARYSERTTVNFYLKRPDGSIVNYWMNKLDFYASTDNSNCHLFLLTPFCYPQAQSLKFLNAVNSHQAQFQFDQQGTWELYSSSDKVKPVFFDVSSPSLGSNLVMFNNAVIDNLPNYTIRSFGKQITPEPSPLVVTFDLIYDFNQPNVSVEVSRSSADNLDKEQHCEGACSSVIPSLRAMGKLVSIDGNNVLIIDPVIRQKYYQNPVSSSTPPSEVYWQSGNAEMYVNLGIGSSSVPIDEQNVLNNEVFKEYLKKYPSSL